MQDRSRMLAQDFERLGFPCEKKMDRVDKAFYQAADLFLMALHEAHRRGQSNSTDHRHLARRDNMSSRLRCAGVVGDGDEGAVVFAIQDPFPAILRRAALFNELYISPIHVQPLLAQE